MATRALDPSRKRSHPLLGRSGGAAYAAGSPTAKPAAPKPAWDSTNHDLSKYALSPEQVLRKKLASISPNDTNAQATLRRRLAASGLVDVTQLVCDADGAVKALELLPAASQRLMNASYMSGAGRVPGGEPLDASDYASLDHSFATAPKHARSVGGVAAEFDTPSTRVSGSPRASVGAQTPSPAFPRGHSATGSARTRSLRGAARSLRPHEIQGDDGYTGDLLTGGIEVLPAGDDEATAEVEAALAATRPSPPGARGRVGGRVMSPYAAAPASLAALGLASGSRRVRPRVVEEEEEEAWSAAVASPPTKRGGAGAGAFEGGEDTAASHVSALGDRLRSARARVSSNPTTARAAAVAAAAARPPPVPAPRSVRVRLPDRLRAAFSDSMCVPVPEARVTAGDCTDVVIERDLSFSSAAREASALDTSLSTIGAEPEEAEAEAAAEAAPAGSCPLAAPAPPAIAHERVQEPVLVAPPAEVLPLAAALEAALGSDASFGALTAGVPAPAAAAAPPPAGAAEPSSTPRVVSVVESIMARYEERVRALLGDTGAASVLAAPAPPAAAPAPAQDTAVPAWEAAEDAQYSDAPAAVPDQEGLAWADAVAAVTQAPADEEDEEMCYVPEVEEDEGALQPRAEAPPAPAAAPAVVADDAPPLASALRASFEANQSLCRLRSWVSTLRAVADATSQEEPLPSTSSLLLQPVAAEEAPAPPAPAAAPAFTAADGSGVLQWMEAPGLAEEEVVSSGLGYHHAAPYDPARYAEMSPEEEALAAGDLDEALVMPPAVQRCVLDEVRSLARRPGISREAVRYALAIEHSCQLGASLSVGEELPPGLWLVEDTFSAALKPVADTLRARILAELDDVIGGTRAGLTTGRDASGGSGSGGFPSVFSSGRGAPAASCFDEPAGFAAGRYATGGLLGGGYDAGSISDADAVGGDDSDSDDGVVPAAAGSGSASDSDDFLDSLLADSSSNGSTPIADASVLQPRAINRPVVPGSAVEGPRAVVPPVSGGGAAAPTAPRLAAPPVGSAPVVLSKSSNPALDALPDVDPAEALSLLLPSPSCCVHLAAFTTWLAATTATTAFVVTAPALPAAWQDEEQQLQLASAQQQQDGGAGCSITSSGSSDETKALFAVLQAALSEARGGLVLEEDEHGNSGQELEEVEEGFWGLQPGPARLARLQRRRRSSGTHASAASITLPLSGKAECSSVDAWVGAAAARLQEAEDSCVSDGGGFAAHDARRAAALAHARLKTGVSGYTEWARAAVVQRRLELALLRGSHRAITAAVGLPVARRGAREVHARGACVKLSQLEPGVGHIPMPTAASVALTQGNDDWGSKRSRRAHSALLRGAGLRTGIFRATPDSNGAAGYVLCVPPVAQSTPLDALDRVRIRGGAAVGDALDGDIVEVAAYPPWRRSGGPDESQSLGSLLEGRVLQVVTRRQAPVAATLLPASNAPVSGPVFYTHAAPVSTALPSLLELHPPYLLVQPEERGAGGVSSPPLLRALVTLHPPPPAQQLPALLSPVEQGRPLPQGTVAKVLGPAGDAATDAAALLLGCGLGAHAVPPGAGQVAPAAAAVIPRRELMASHPVLFSIDAPGTLDVDDCLSLRVLPSSVPADLVVEVGIHIADVASFLLPGSPADAAAALRGVSLYTPEQRLPMLGPVPGSSAGVAGPSPASLSPGHLRHAVSLLLTCRKTVRPGTTASQPGWEAASAWVGLTQVRSERAMSFAQANALLGEHDSATSAGGPAAGVATALSTLESIALQLWRGYDAGGAGPPEAGPALAEGASEGGRAGRLVAALMLTTNRLLAAALKARFNVCPLVRPFVPAAAFADAGADATAQPATPEQPAASVAARVATTAARLGLVPSSASSTAATKAAAGPAVALLWTTAPAPPQGAAATETPAFKECGLELPVQWAQALLAPRLPPGQTHLAQEATSWYTLGTSPLRRYTDVMVQRLLHACIADAARAATSRRLPGPESPRKSSATSDSEADSDSDDLLSELLDEEVPKQPALPQPPPVAPASSLRLNLAPLTALVARQRAVVRAAAVAEEAFKSLHLAKALGLSRPGGFAVLPVSRCLGVEVAAVATAGGGRGGLLPPPGGSAHRDVTLTVQVAPPTASGDAGSASVSIPVPLGRFVYWKDGRTALELLLPPDLEAGKTAGAAAGDARGDSLAFPPTLLPDAVAEALAASGALPVPRKLPASNDALAEIVSALSTPHSGSMQQQPPRFDVCVVWQPDPGTALVTPAAATSSPSPGWLHPPQLWAFLVGPLPSHAYTSITSAQQASPAPAPFPSPPTSVAPLPSSAPPSLASEVQLVMEAFSAPSEAATAALGRPGKPPRVRKTQRLVLPGGRGRLRFGPPGASFAHIEPPAAPSYADDDRDFPTRRIVYKAPELSAEALAAHSRSAARGGTQLGDFIAAPPGLGLAGGQEDPARFLVRDVHALDYPAFTTYASQAAGAEEGAAASRLVGLEREATARAARLRAERQHDRIDKQKKAERGGGGGGGRSR